MSKNADIADKKKGKKRTAARPGGSRRIAAPEAWAEELWLVRSRDVAELFGVTMRTIRRWRATGLPSAGRDKFPLIAVIRWREARIREEYGGGTDDERRLASAQADEREHRAALAGLERRHREGELVELAEVQAERLERIYACKAALRNLGEILAGQLAGQTPAKIRAITREEVRRCLQRFAGEQ